MDISRRRNVAVVGLHHAGKTTLIEAILAPLRRDPAPRLGCRRHDDDRLRAGVHRARAIDVRRFRARRLRRDRSHLDRRARVRRLFRRDEDRAAGRRRGDRRRRRRSGPHPANARPDRLSRIAASIPHLFFINKMDRPGAAFSATLDALVDRLRHPRRVPSSSRSARVKRFAATSTSRRASRTSSTTGPCARSRSTMR